jgi:hypothetical protein
MVAYENNMVGSTEPSRFPTPERARSGVKRANWCRIDSFSARTACSGSHDISGSGVGSQRSIFKRKQAFMPMRFITRLRGLALKLVTELWGGAAGQYRPEVHYMRGPGPKWHQKHFSESKGSPIPRSRSF